MLQKKEEKLKSKGARTSLNMPKKKKIKEELSNNPSEVGSSHTDHIILVTYRKYIVGKEGLRAENWGPTLMEED